MTSDPVKMWTDSLRKAPPADAPTGRFVPVLAFDTEADLDDYAAEVARLERERAEQVRDIAAVAVHAVDGARDGRSLDGVADRLSLLAGDKWEHLHSRPSECRRFLSERFDDVCGAARSVGYAIAVHGSLARDIDLVAVPWTDEACSAERLVSVLMDAIGRCDFCNGEQPERKPQGRLGWSIWLHGYKVYIDLSVAALATPTGDTTDGSV